MRKRIFGVLLSCLLFSLLVVISTWLVAVVESPQVPAATLSQITYGFVLMTVFAIIPYVLLGLAIDIVTLWYKVSVSQIVWATGVIVFVRSSIMMLIDNYTLDLSSTYFLFGGSIVAAIGSIPLASVCSNSKIISK